MMQATNEVVKLNEELVKIGTELNKWRGVYNEIKARIKTQKEIINSLKVAIRAEASQI
jgi:capsule polysaccharide export protein KpsE/RkpR